jgi:hypothetical protein
MTEKHEILHKKVAFIYTNVNQAKIYQSRIFEKFLKDVHGKARMQRGHLRGHLRDSWRYSVKGYLQEYTTYEAFKVTDPGSALQLTGKGITHIVFLEGNWDSKTLNHVYLRLNQ